MYSRNRASISMQIVPISIVQIRAIVTLLSLLWCLIIRSTIEKRGSFRRPCKICRFVQKTLPCLSFLEYYAICTALEITTLAGRAIYREFSTYRCLLLFMLCADRFSRSTKSTLPLLGKSQSCLLNKRIRIKKISLTDGILGPGMNGLERSQTVPFAQT